MGFAVVAEEVRTLAHRSAQAAKDTASLIEESISRSAEGRAKLDEVSKAVVAVTENTTKVKTLVDEVNLGSQEQARRIEQIAKAVSQMEQVTQKNAASAEQSASAGQEMSAEAQSMRNAIVNLQALVGSSASQSTGNSQGMISRARAPIERSKPGGVQHGRQLDEKKAVVGKPQKAALVTNSPAAASTSDPQEFPLDSEFKEF
jgi:methyl-accepting chemotaxis protein/methyl-accepting chemotaxis protein-1 (serine sensor receptor)